MNAHFLEDTCLKDKNNNGRISDYRRKGTGEESIK